MIPRCRVTLQLGLESSNSIHFQGLQGADSLWQKFCLTELLSDGFQIDLSNKTNCRFYYFK
ncbi:hypothetical protein ASE92_13685 [Pedobacter sp. Leaf41]|nr:hypothetical protein ASE92_13685 [Pedobacter sp. Leaf41]